MDYFSRMLKDSIHPPDRGFLLKHRAGDSLCLQMQMIIINIKNLWVI